MATDSQKKHMSPMAAGVAGGLIGAAIAAGAMILADPKNRKNADKKIKDLRSWGDKALQDLKHNSAEVVEETQDKIDDMTAKSDDHSSKFKTTATK